MTDGNDALLEALRLRKMKVETTPLNLVEKSVTGIGNLDGMTVDLTVNCISGMPAESAGALIIEGNLAALLAVLERVWPGPPGQREILSPGRQSWPEGERPTPIKKSD
ncbi:MAG TPA: hypothetical protein VK191_09255 [Symbiobacteriaceae bacterium]|nr:hypothetical protein [Symbiobacteriaceae bacterium]